MKRTKVAILGAGFITNIHMESYHRFVPEAEVVAVYARNAEKAQAFAEKYHIPKWYDELDDIIQNSVVKSWIFVCQIFYILKLR